MFVFFTQINPTVCLLHVLTLVLGQCYCQYVILLDFSSSLVAIGCWWRLLQADRLALRLSKPMNSLTVYASLCQTDIQRSVWCESERYKCQRMPNWCWSHRFSDFVLVIGVDCSCSTNFILASPFIWPCSIPWYGITVMLNPLFSWLISILGYIC